MPTAGRGETSFDVAADGFGTGGSGVSEPHPPTATAAEGIERTTTIWEGYDMIDLLAMSGAAATLLWIVAAVLVIAGIVTAIRGGVLAGIVLIVVGLLIGPGGVSIFK